ncbi:hypothetical protein JTB14_028085 [Gonioctena quinquepunctata]|nr:hypothetical protein JTB14_028085 [Gonioctena quinquepunctata]
MTDLNILKRQRDSIKARVKGFEKYLNDVISNLDTNDLNYHEKIIELEIKVNRQEGLLIEFSKIQELIEVHDDITLAQVPSQYEERERFESNHYTLHSRAKAVIAKYREAEFDNFGSEKGSQNSGA